MGFITHIPGTQPVPTPERHPKSLGVGVVGLHEGRTLLLATASRCTMAHPAAGCDLSTEKLDASRKELPDLFYTTKYEDMLARPEVGIVAIYTPDSAHADHIIAAFRAGKHVICTKPIVNSTADAKKILQAGRETGKRLLVGQSTRFFEAFLRQRAAFDRGEIGRPELVDAHYIHRMDWYYKKSPWVATDTDWVFLGLSHPIDLIRWYLGRIREVHAYATASELGQRHDLKGNDIYIVNLISESGRVGRVMGHYGCHELPTARNCIELVLYGSEGTSLAQYHDMRYIHTARADAQHAAGGPHAADAGRPAQTGSGFMPVPRRFDAGELAEITEDCLYAGRHYYFNSEVHGMHYGEFANYAETFAKAIIENRPTSPELEEGVETFCVMEAVRRSSREGKPVPLAPLLREVGLTA